MKLFPMLIYSNRNHSVHSQPKQMNGQLLSCGHRPFCVPTPRLPPPKIVMCEQESIPVGCVPHFCTDHTCFNSHRIWALFGGSCTVRDHIQRAAGPRGTYTVRFHVLRGPVDHGSDHCKKKDWQIHTTENITFPQLHWLEVKNYLRDSGILTFTFTFTECFLYIEFDLINWTNWTNYTDILLFL